MIAEELAAEARALLDDPQARTHRWWSRGAALVARQALESRIRVVLSKRHADPEKMTFTAQMLVFPEVVGPDLGGRASAAWAGLSAATHHHAYEIPATADELRAWLEVVDEVIAATADR